MIAGKQQESKRYCGFYNVGPDDRDCVTTGKLTDLFCRCWGDGLTWTDRSDGGPHEASFLKLDCSRLKSVFGWQPSWDVEMAVGKTVEWAKCHGRGGDAAACMDRQIEEFMD